MIEIGLQAAVVIRGLIICGPRKYTNLDVSLAYLRFIDENGLKNTSK
jgi:hypothetical protein